MKNSKDMVHERVYLTKTMLLEGKSVKEIGLKIGIKDMMLFFIRNRKHFDDMYFVKNRRSIWDNI